MMSFRLKTIIGVGVIEAILLVILITTSLDLLRSTKETELTKLANTTAVLFSTATKDAVISSDLASLYSFVNEVMKNPTLIYARVLSADGEVLAEQSQPGVVLGPFVQDQTVDDATDGVFDAFAVITEAEDIYGRVELGFSIGEIDVLMQHARQKTLIIALVEILLSATFSFALGYYLTRQLAELKHASKKIVAGDLGVEIPVKSKDEIGEVAEAFNNMSQSLKVMWKERDAAQEELVTLNAALEQKVADRTRQLEDAQKAGLESAHRAGMADVAAGALHNIGNLINSAKTSTNMILDSAQGSNLKKLDRARELLVEKLEDFSTFSDDENNATLLQYIVSISEELNKEQDQMRSQLRDIHDSIESTAQTIREQQRYAKNPMRFESDVDLTKVVQETLSLSRSRIDALGVEINTTFDENYSHIYSQKNKIHQIIFNLIINAVDAIEMSDQSKGVIDVIVEPYKDASVRVIVKDNGCGIAEDKLNAIFHYGITSKVTGNGAGLHSSANLATEIGGKIHVSSEGEGEGAVFELVLPKSKRR